MGKKEDILARCRASLVSCRKYDMPRLDDIGGIEYPDPAAQFRMTAEAMGARIIELGENDDINQVIKNAYPDAETFCTNIPGITIATSNPDTVPSAASLNGTDVGIVRGEYGVAENGCIWVEQTMKERAVCFISENLVILMERDKVVSNMHEAYPHMKFNSNGYGVYISGPSKTADIAQVLVTGAQAARTVTIILLPQKTV